jgi:hypothetical protein
MDILERWLIVAVWTEEIGLKASAQTLITSMEQYWHVQ